MDERAVAGRPGACLTAMLRLEPRPQPSARMAWASPLIALAVTVAVGVALFVLLGKDPVRGLQVFFVEPQPWTDQPAQARQHA